MTSPTSSTMTALRFVILTAVIALMAMTTAGNVSAEGDNDSYDNTIIQISACKLAGGEADVNQLQTGSGFYATSVDCNGGLLDGMACSNTPDHGSNCHWRDDEVPERRVESSNDYSAGETTVIAPPDEPAETPVVVVEPVLPVEEIVSGGGETITPEATEEPMQGQADTADPTATPTPEQGDTILQDPILTDPLSSDDGAIAPEATVGPIEPELETGGKSIDGIDSTILIEDAVIAPGR